jgi:hypothetical protein
VSDDVSDSVSDDVSDAVSDCVNISFSCSSSTTCLLSLTHDDDHQVSIENFIQDQLFTTNIPLSLLAFWSVSDGVSDDVSDCSGVRVNSTSFLQQLCVRFYAR